MSTFSTS